MPNKRHSRQSFLGKNSAKIITSTKVAVIGLGGGGSHIVQQLAHIGFLNYMLFDPQTVELSNLNRLVGATQADVDVTAFKTTIAERLVLGIQPEAKIKLVQNRWQDSAELLRGCDIIFGCVDTFKERSELEASARRYLIPYIDIGMDVIKIKGQPPRMAGQIILSLPGNLCMRCLNYLTDKKLALEAAKYGAVGGRPQVVWANGTLASTAVSIAMDLLTSWTKNQQNFVYLSYDGNSPGLGVHPAANYELPDSCTHYPISSAGDPVFINLEPNNFIFNKTYGKIQVKKLHIKERAVAGH